VLAATVVSVLVVGLVGNVLRAGASDRPSRTVVVRPGDTLWTIAARAEPALDPRAVVAAIEASNGVDPAAIVPGQRLVVPAS